MTTSIAGRKRCSCGRYLTPLANGTMPRHTRPSHTLDHLTRADNQRVRVRCEGTGKFPPSDRRSQRKGKAEK